MRVKEVDSSDLSVGDQVWDADNGLREIVKIDGEHIWSREINTVAERHTSINSSRQFYKVVEPISY